MKEVVVIPYAPNLVESTRSIGYSFEAAVADIMPLNRTQYIGETTAYNKKATIDLMQRFVR